MLAYFLGGLGLFGREFANITPAFSTSSTDDFANVATAFCPASGAASGIHLP